VVKISFIFIFFVGSPSSEFQEVEGETEERRKARLGRHQRAQERAVCVIIILSLFPLIKKGKLINANYTSSSLAYNDVYSDQHMIFLHTLP